jgi:spore coat protein U-like protein
MNCIQRNLRNLLPLLGMCCAMGSHAATQTATMDVSATIVASCKLSVMGLKFDNVEPGVDKNAAAVLASTCTSGTAFTLDLSNGGHSTTTGGTGDQFRRQMASGNNRLPYILYKDGGAEIGASATGAGNNNLLTDGMGNGYEKYMNIYGRVIGAETKNSRAGNYSDQVVVTIAF